MEAAMDLMRRMPPNQSEAALSSLLTLLPHHSQELLSRVDQPIQVLFDAELGKEFLLCDYNRDGDSYRSPWSSKYHPSLEDGSQPSSYYRKLELEANETFAAYRELYYEGGISSVYMWETDEREGFAACFLVKKDGSKSGQGRRGFLKEGIWDAIHVIEVKGQSDDSAHYCLTSTVMLSLTTEDKSSGKFNLSGSITRQAASYHQISAGHIRNMVSMIEDMERKLRDTLEVVYFGKTKEMVFNLHQVQRSERLLNM